MSLAEQNIAVALRSGEVWQQGSLDDLDAIFAADFVDYAPSGEGTPGLEPLKVRFRLLKDAFPDLAYAYKQIISEGEYVVLHWLVSGTHRGLFWVIQQRADGSGGTAVPFCGWCRGKLWSAGRIRILTVSFSNSVETPCPPLDPSGEERFDNKYYACCWQVA